MKISNGEDGKGEYGEQNSGDGDNEHREKEEEEERAI